MVVNNGTTNAVLHGRLPSKQQRADRTKVTVSESWICTFIVCSLAYIKLVRFDFPFILLTTCHHCHNPFPPPARSTPFVHHRPPSSKHCTPYICILLQHFPFASCFSMQIVPDARRFAPVPDFGSSGGGGTRHRCTGCSCALPPRLA